MSRIKRYFTALLYACTASVLLQSLTAFAQPYGKSLYGENVPYGSETSLSITTTGDLIIPVTPTSSGSLETGSNTVTVTCTDVKGYKLYVRSLNSTEMMNVDTPLPASNNDTPAPLTINTWGYNTNGTSNFVGMLATDCLIRTTVSPATTGEDTIVTYGENIDLSKPAGNYQTAVIYTAVPQTN